MGFLVPTDVVPLSFSHPSLEGFEVWMGRPPIEAIGDMMLMGGIDSGSMTEDDVKRLVRVFNAFALCLKRWNAEVQVLDEHGVPTGEKIPVPATAEGIRSLDGNFMLLVILGWIETVTGLSWKIKDTKDIPMITNDGN